MERNKRPRGAYNASYAQMLADERKKEGHYKTVFSPRMKEIIKDKLEQEWSPEQINGWCRRKGIEMVSHERIYQYIWADKRNGGILYKHLRHACRKYRKRYGSKDSRGRIKDRVSIEERPDIVDKKGRFGDWEMDLIVGKEHKGAALSIVERKSGFLILAKTNGKKAGSIRKQAINAMALYRKPVHTITNDNGKEFALHKEIASKLDTEIYFCHPYASWERPRKKLDFKTPLEDFTNNFNP